MATRKRAATSKKSTAKKPAAKAKKPALATKPKASDLPTAADAALAASAKARSSVGKSPPLELGYLFTGDAVARLTAPSVVAFLGSGYKGDSLLDDAIAATAAAATRDRFQNAVAVAAQQYVDPASRLLARLSLLMSRWDALVAEDPDAARALAEVRTWWQEHHKSGPHKPQDPPK